MKPIHYTRAQALPGILAHRIAILDGAMGTMIQRFKLGEAQYRGERFKDFHKDVKGNNELLSLTRPDVIRDIHEGYLAAGADLIETNTFGATSVAQADYDMAHLAREMNLASAKLAREACDKFSTPDHPRFVAGALGPTPKTASISPDVNDPGARNITFEELRAAYYEQVEALVEGGADVLLVETIFDTLNAKAALFAIDEYFEKSGERLPLIISGTVTDASGRILSGQTVTAFWHSVRHAQPLAIGLNCALGAALMRPYIQELARVAPDTFISCYPNAGLPNPMSETGFAARSSGPGRTAGSGASAQQQNGCHGGGGRHGLDQQDLAAGGSDAIEAGHGHAAENEQQRVALADDQGPGDACSEEAVVKALVGRQYLGGLGEVGAEAERLHAPRLVPEEHLQYQDVDMDDADHKGQGDSNDVHGASLLLSCGP